MLKSNKNRFSKFLALSGAKQIIEAAHRAWYMKGQEWYDLGGTIDDVMLEDWPDKKRGPFLMGFNAAALVERCYEPSVRGTATWLNRPNRMIV